ncbi:MAG: hypothetical protein ACFFEV_06205 [Candidatus Thorarchaeota archaeon]
MNKPKAIVLVLFLSVVIVGSSLASTADAIQVWYEYEYKTFTDDDYYVEEGWPYSEFTAKFWLHTVVKLRRTIKVTYNERLDKYLRTPITPWYWYKITHDCKMQQWYDPTTWVSASTQVYMYIQNIHETTAKWEANPLGNMATYTAYPMDGGSMIPFVEDDACRDNAHHYSILPPEDDPNGDPDGDAITCEIHPYV